MDFTLFKMFLKNCVYNNCEKRAKLGITYSIFNGEELLENSIKSIRNGVDYINVIYQKQSWFGKECSTRLIPILYDLQSRGLINNIIEYDDFDVNNEESIEKHILHKKNLGIKDLKLNNCTHCLIMDADEFYNEEDFLEAKKFILDHKITHSACSLYDYRYLPEIRNRDISKYAVPFIFKLKRWSKLTNNHNMPCLVDGLRTLRFNKLIDKFYYFNTITMHHMTGIRFNYFDKLDASVSNCTNSGKEHINNTRVTFNRESVMGKEELLIQKNIWGGYIDVGDEFNINCIFASKNNDNLEEKI